MEIIQQYAEKLKNKVIQSEGFNVKESWHYKHPSVIWRHSVTSFLSPDDGLLKPKHYNIDFLSY